MVAVFLPCLMIAWPRQRETQALQAVGKEDRSMLVLTLMAGSVETTEKRLHLYLILMPL